MFERIQLTRRSALGLGAAALAPVPLTAPARGASKVDGAVAKIVRERVAPGVSVAVTRSGRAVYSGVYGLANLETSTAVTPQTIFKVGSLTKQFTAAAVLLLADEGKLSLEDPLSRFYPDLPRAADISIYRMLTHTSGMNAYDGDHVQLDALHRLLRLDYDEPGILDIIKSVKPYMLAEPGTGWFYSDSAYTLLGLIIGKVAGEPYARYCHRRIIDPLGLAQTSFYDARPVVPNRASGYEIDRKMPGGFVNAPFWAGSIDRAAGGLQTTPGDMCRWHEALLRGRLLTRQARERMFTPVRLANGDLPLRSGAPDGSSPPRPREYGMGIGMGEFRGERFISHSGAVPGFVAELRTFPGEMLTVACFINSTSGDDGTSFDAASTLRDEVASLFLG